MNVSAAMSPNEADSAIEFAVEPFGACAAEVLAFRNLNRAVAREQRYLEWRYGRPCRQEPLIVWARDSDGRPLGAASVIAHDYFVLDGIYPVGLLGDISVLPSHQGRGIAGRMLGFLAQHEALRRLRACVVLPNDEAERPLRRAGWHEATTIHRFVKLLNTAPLLQRRIGSAAAVGWIAAGANALLRALTLDYAGRSSARYEISETTVFDARYDALWQAVALPGRVLAVRNRDYLTWRFADYPLGSHRVHEVSRAGELAGYVVFQTDGELAVVEDYLVAQVDTIVPLFTSFFNRLRQEGRSVKVQVRTHRDARLALPWLRLGLMRRKDTQRVLVLDPHATDGVLACSSYEWHVTPADKDV